MSVFQPEAGVSRIPAELLLHASSFLPLEDAAPLAGLSAHHARLWRSLLLRSRLHANGRIDLHFRGAEPASILRWLGAHWPGAPTCAPRFALSIRSDKIGSKDLREVLRLLGLRQSPVSCLSLRGCRRLALETLGAARGGNDLASLHQAERAPWAPLGADSLGDILCGLLPPLAQLELSDCGVALASSRLALDLQQSNVASIDAAHRVFAIGDAVLRPIAAHCASHLRELRLYNCCAMTDAAIEEIARCCPQLELLDAGCDVEQSLNLPRVGRRITQASLAALASGCRGLAALSLQGCRELRPPGHDGAEALLLLAHLGALRELHLGGVERLDDADVAALLALADGPGPRAARAAPFAEGNAAAQQHFGGGNAAMQQQFGAGIAAAQQQFGAGIAAAQQQFGGGNAAAQQHFDGGNAAAQQHFGGGNAAAQQHFGGGIAAPHTSSGARPAAPRGSSPPAPPRRALEALSLCYCRCISPQGFSRGFDAHGEGLVSLNLAFTRVDGGGLLSIARRCGALERLNLVHSNLKNGAATRHALSLLRRALSVNLRCCAKLAMRREEAAALLPRGCELLGLEGAEDLSRVVDLGRMPRASATQMVAWDAWSGRSGDALLAAAQRFFPAARVTFMQATPPGLRSSTLLRRSIWQPKAPLDGQTLLYVMVDAEGRVLWGGGF